MCVCVWPRKEEEEINNRCSLLFAVIPERGAMGLEAAAGSSTGSQA